MVTAIGPLPFPSCGIDPDYTMGSDDVRGELLTVCEGALCSISHVTQVSWVFSPSIGASSLRPSGPLAVSQGDQFGPVPSDPILGLRISATAPPLGGAPRPCAVSTASPKPLFFGSPIFSVVVLQPGPQRTALVSLMVRLRFFSW